MWHLNLQVTNSLSSGISVGHLCEKVFIFLNLAQCTLNIRQFLGVVKSHHSRSVVFRGYMWPPAFALTGTRQRPFACLGPSLSGVFRLVSLPALGQGLSAGLCSSTPTACNCSAGASWLGQGNQFFVSMYLGRSTQWFHEMLIQVLLWKYFIDVADMGNKLTCSEGDKPQKCEWASSSQLKGLKSKNWDFLQEEEILLQDCTINSCVSFQPAQKISFWLVPTIP